MTIYRLMDGVSGRPGVGSSGTQPPASPTAYTGNFLAGTVFQVTSWGMWFEGFWWWVPIGGDSGPHKFALWQVTNTNAGTLVSGGTTTSGALTAGQWNYVALGTPILLTANVPYVAATGWASVHGFPDTNNQFGSGQPYAAGITNGPLMAYSDAGGSAPSPSRWTAQGLYSTAGSDPAVQMPNFGSNSANFWVDVQVSDVAPAGTSYRLWPGLPVPPNTIQDTAANFTLATEFTLAETCSLNNVWFYSAPSFTQLPTEVGIYDQATQTLVAGTHNTSPSWSEAAGSGWVSCAYSGVSLPAGSYRVAVCNGAGSPSVWNNATPDYFSTGPGASGIAPGGPLSAPGESTAGSPGQGSYTTGAALTWPGTYDTGGAPSYWVDAEVTPAAGTAHTAGASLTVVPVFSAGRTRGWVRQASLSVTPTLSAGCILGRTRSATLAVTPTLAAGRVVGKVRSAALSVTPVFQAGVAQTANLVRAAALTITPTFLAGGVRAMVRSAALSVTPVFRAVGISTDRPIVTMTLLVTSEINVYAGLTLEATIEMNVGAPYQGNISSLATDRWYACYPS